MVVRVNLLRKFNLSTSQEPLVQVHFLMNLLVFLLENVLVNIHLIVALILTNLDQQNPHWII